ncbi:hypothetical protein R5R35_007265 [Gryllus longicercus]|uniref:FF domain-containing protein n=1 Tax=Gryllus longicercus TaxID=2509291 RepID=A0AAN9ZEC6_9ORTH
MQNCNKVITQFRCEKCSQIVGDNRYQSNTEQENGLVLLSEVSDVLRNQNSSEADPRDIGIYKNLMCICGIALGWFYLTVSINASHLTEVFVLLNNKIVREMLVNACSNKEDCCSKLSTISENSITSDPPDADYMSSPQRETQIPNGYANKQEWVEDFKKLLEGKNFSGSTAWRVALRALEADPQYARFRSLPERRQLFNQHKTQRSKVELEERRAREKEARDRLEHLLLTCGKVDARTPYARCEELLGGDEAWAAVAESQRRELLGDVRTALERREREQARARRRRSVRALAAVLALLRLPASTTWHEAQAQLLLCPQFACDASLLAMDKLDALAAFEEYIRGEEQRERAQAKRLRERQRRRAAREGRCARDAFLALLAERRARGALHARSLWKEQQPHLLPDPRYQALLRHAAEHDGSTPLDLFKFYVEELKDKYYKDKKMVQKILEEHNLVVKARSCYEDFARAVAVDARSDDVEPANLRLVFLSMVRRARQRRGGDNHHH